MQIDTNVYRPTILIVDDMQENLMLLSEILKSKYQIKIAKDGQKALDIVDEGGIDLILLDIVMPKLDGYEVCQALQANPETKHIPIIFVTANTSVEDEKKGFEVGAVDYINKPFSAVTVKARVKTHLNLYLQAKQLQEELEKNRQKDVLLQQQARLAALGEMIGNIAHQWRQPLSVISTAISGLKLKNDYGILEDNDIEKTNKIVMESAEFLSKTIDDFRNFFKKDQPKKDFTIDEALVETVNIIKASYDNHYIKLDMDIEKDIHYFGSKNLLCQVFLNLFSNAKDALVSKDIEEKKVWVSVKQQNHTIVIMICDNAGGVPPQIMEKIFDPYFTTKHQSQGTGLGLYMSRMILQNHFDGSLQVHNTTSSEAGACFCVDIENKKEPLSEEPLTK